jgi:hypothetical protein
MDYRGWTIKIFTTYHGYSAHYISPIGQEFNTSDCFGSEEQALWYARSRIDGILRWEGSRQAALTGASR